MQVVMGGEGGGARGDLGALPALIPKALQNQVKKSEMKAEMGHRMSEDGTAVSSELQCRPTFMHSPPCPSTAPPSTSSHCPTAEYYTNVDNFRKDMLQQKMVSSGKCLCLSHDSHMTLCLSHDFVPASSKLPSGKEQGRTNWAYLWGLSVD